MSQALTSLVEDRAALDTEMGPPIAVFVNLRWPPCDSPYGDHLEHRKPPILRLSKTVVSHALALGPLLTACWQLEVDQCGGIPVTGQICSAGLEVRDPELLDVVDLAGVNAAACAGGRSGYPNSYTM